MERPERLEERKEKERIVLVATTTTATAIWNVSWKVESAGMASVVSECSRPPG